LSASFQFLRKLNSPCMTQTLSPLNLSADGTEAIQSLKMTPNMSS
jgi:hypothetical protein